MNQNAKIYVAGHTGMVGAALLTALERQGYHNRVVRSRDELDLLDQQAVIEFFRSERPEYVFFAAGRTGGIHANNTYRADFIYENIMMQSNVIHQAFMHEVQKLIFFACSSVFPKVCPKLITEEHLLTGPIEPTNEPFAVAKIAGIKMCESYNRQYGTDFITVIPTNLYGPNQRYALMNAHVVPALIRKFHHAREKGADSVLLWGSGRPSRDLLYVDDLADASLFLMENYSGDVLLNVGTGQQCTIAELAEVIRGEVGFTGKILYDTSHPDGVLEKLQDVSRINDLGWRHQVELKEGIHRTYQDFCARLAGGEMDLR
ncbi:MAG: GDP-L-fucose synthase [Magnetococcales bacterium]|nr:GDP-L-fucose synthase [Magnetococcales bacterium]